MITDDLIRRLSSEYRPMPAYSLRLRLRATSMVGASLGLVALLGVYGVRPDLGVAVTTFSFWMKAAYAASMAFVAILLLNDLARPEGRPNLALFAAPIGLLALLAGLEFAANPSSGWRALIMGMSAGKCSVRIALFALPTFILLMTAFRRFAPTRLAETGAVIGAGAGAIGALVYMFYCREVAAGFVLVWYTLGILSMAAAGGVIGRFLLRWR